MTTNSTITGNKEILLVAETIAHEKGISTNDVVEAMEEGIKIAAKKKYGINLDIDCKIDRKIGKISLYNKLEIIEKEDEDFNYRTQISISQAQKDNKDLKVGDHVIQELPPIDLSRVVAQVARNEIIRKSQRSRKN